MQIQKYIYYIYKVNYELTQVNKTAACAGNISDEREYTAIAMAAQRYPIMHIMLITRSYKYNVVQGMHSILMRRIMYVAIAIAASLTIRGKRYQRDLPTGIFMYNSFK